MAADKKKRTGILPWGLNEEELKPNSVQVRISEGTCWVDSRYHGVPLSIQELSQSKLKAFAIGKTGTAHKPNPFQKKKEEREEKKKVRAAYAKFSYSTVNSTCTMYSHTCECTCVLSSVV